VAETKPSTAGESRANQETFSVPSDVSAQAGTPAKIDAPFERGPRAPRQIGQEISGSAAQTFRLLLFGVILAPVLLLAGSGYLAYVAYEAVFEHAASNLARATEVAEEHALKVLDTHKLAALRIDELVAGLSDQELRTQEQSLHRQMAQQIRALPQVETAWVEDRMGHPLVTATVYPADRSLDLSDQDYFRALQDPATETFIGAIPSRRTSRPLFTVAQRRTGTSGGFDGVIVVGVSPDYFRDFYDKLLGNRRDYTTGLYRADGATLACYPEVVWRGSRPVVPTPLLGAIGHQPDKGIFTDPPGFDDVQQMVAYKRIGDYPLYVTVGRTRASILREWQNLMIRDLYFSVPAASGLVLLSVFAWRRTRREQETLSRLRQALARREAAEEQLRQAQKMEAIGQLTSGVAHDFNNLLTVVAGNIELLQRRLGARDHELQRFAAAAMRGVERASTLTHRLLAFSRRQPLDPRPVDVNRLVIGMMDLLRRTLGEHVAVQAVLAEGVCASCVDSNELEHSLLNLAINARDAMPKGGTLTIETARSYIDEAAAAADHEVAAGEYNVISVVDTGSGMSRAVLDKAFDPFFTTKEAGQGTGLGLSQVYGFIRQSGGHCSIFSEPGVGTTVRLFLPRHFGPPDPIVEKPKPAAGGARRRDTILVVEDDEDVRNFAVAMLGELGYDVLAAPDGIAAMGMLDLHPEIRLLLTDCALPGGMNGRDLAEAARRRQAGLKVLYTTGYADNTVVHHGRLDPGIALIAKPFTAAALAEKVQQLLEVIGSPAASRRRSNDLASVSAPDNA
jgi:signal transduction histidine kinase/FixJ family two-component response regulator